jgi:hypothetical protein
LDIEPLPLSKSESIKGLKWAPTHNSSGLTQSTVNLLDTCDIEKSSSSKSKHQKRSGSKTNEKSGKSSSVNSKVKPKRKMVIKYENETAPSYRRQSSAPSICHNKSEISLPDILGEGKIKNRDERDNNKRVDNTKYSRQASAPTGTRRTASSAYQKPTSMLETNNSADARKSDSFKESSEMWTEALLNFSALPVVDRAILPRVKSCKDNLCSKLSDDLETLECIADSSEEDEASNNKPSIPAPIFASGLKSKKNSSSSTETNSSTADDVP